MENVYLTNMFPDYVPPEDLAMALSQAAIVAADIDPEKRSVSVVVHAESYIPQRLTGRLKKGSTQQKNTSKDQKKQLPMKLNVSHGHTSFVDLTISHLSFFVNIAHIFSHYCCVFGLFRL